jgi:hypothetical protein
MTQRSPRYDGGVRWLAITAIGVTACGRIGFGSLITGDGGGPNEDGHTHASDAPAVAPHEVQFAKNFNTTNISQLSVTLPQPTAAGDLVVVAAGGYGAIASVDDDAPGGTSAYQDTGAIATDSNTDYSDIWFAPASRPGATTVTVHMTVSNVITLWVAEFAGFAASPLGSAEIGHDNTASTTLTSPDLVVQVPASLVFVLAGMDTETVSPMSTTFTDLGQQNSDDVAYLIASAPGTYTAAWTLTPAAVWVTSGVVFVPAS